ncbi:MAG: TIGR00341 family protein [Sulfuriflexus sp.]|nr:TIGR00341 family protein [Sulfuriflexus sp.]
MKIIEVIADHGHLDTILGIAEQQGVADHWQSAVAEDGRCAIRMLVSPDSRQAVLDALQSVLGTSENARIIVTPVEVSLPREEENEDDKAQRKTALSREELYNTVSQSNRLDGRFLLLVFLSTIVVMVGLLEDNVAVVIGAMVIAPFLGPNIALALGGALGDNQLIWQALKTNLTGMIFALSLCALLGWWWPYEISSQELLARTNVGLGSIALALASGAAAVLSMTTGLSSVLVGVMVAVALLPPAATLGFMLGSGNYDYATGAGLLLAVNIVSVNLAAKLGFLFLGIKPRTWLEQQRARQSIASYIAFWLVSLIALGSLIYLRGQI